MHYLRRNNLNHIEAMLLKVSVWCAAAFIQLAFAPLLGSAVPDQHQTLR
ncbi:hypothetical protein [Nitrosomonas sp.]|nr:hypothetical protein [Nitrosomonas sp.]